MTIVYIISAFDKKTEKLVHTIELTGKDIDFVAGVAGVCRLEERLYQIALFYGHLKNYQENGVEWFFEAVEKRS